MTIQIMAKGGKVDAVTILSDPAPHEKIIMKKGDQT